MFARRNLQNNDHRRHSLNGVKSYKSAFARGNGTQLAGLQHRRSANRRSQSAGPATRPSLKKYTNNVNTAAGARHNSVVTHLRAAGGPSTAVHRRGREYTVVVNTKPFGFDFREGTTSIVQVRAGSAAEAAGVINHSTIVKLNGRRVHGASWFKMFQNLRTPFTMAMLPPYAHAAQNRSDISCVGRQFNRFSLNDTPLNRKNVLQDINTVSRSIWESLRKARELMSSSQARNEEHGALNPRHAEARRMWLQPIVSMVLLGERALLPSGSISTTLADKLLHEETSLRLQTAPHYSTGNNKSKADRLLRSLSRVHKVNPSKYRDLVKEWMKVRARDSGPAVPTATPPESSAPPTSARRSPNKSLERQPKTFGNNQNPIKTPWQARGPRKHPHASPEPPRDRSGPSATMPDRSLPIPSRSKTQSPHPARKMRCAKEFSRQAASVLLLSEDPGKPTRLEKLAGEVIEYMAGNVRDNNTFPENGWIYPCVHCFRPTSCTLRQPHTKYLPSTNKETEIYLCRSCQRKSARDGTVARLQGTLRRRSNIRVMVPKPQPRAMVPRRI